MKVLHVALGSPEIDKAFRAKGHEVRRIEWRGLKAERLIYLTSIVTKEAEEFKPDLVFMQIQTPGIVERQLIEKLRSLGAFVLNWTGDVRENIDWYLELGPFFNVTCFTNGTDIDTFKAKGLSADYLQIGYDPEIYYLDKRERRGKGVVFLGNNYIDRFPESKRRAEVVNKYLDKGLKAWGGKWGNSTMRTTPDMERVIYNLNRYALNLDHFDRPLFYSDRVIRAQACGAVICQMSDVDISAEHPYVQYGYPNEYSDTPTPKEVAEYTRVNHSWEARIPRIIEIMEKHL